MRNIAGNAVKKPRTLRTPQNAIWCGMWVTSLGLFLLAGWDILGTFGWSLYSVMVLGAVGLGPLLALTMLCGFNLNISELPERGAVGLATRARAGQFQQADLRYRARRQLEWNSPVRTSVRARVIPLRGHHLEPGCDQGEKGENNIARGQRWVHCDDEVDSQRHDLGQPYLGVSVPKMIFQAPIVALVLIASSAAVASAWPSGFEPGSAMYWCSSDPELNARNAFTVWVDKTKQVMAVSPSREGSILPAYAKQLVLNDDAESGLTYKKTKTGYFLTPGFDGFSHQVLIANIAAVCRQTFED